MTPAEELTAAANKLDALTAETSPGPWGYNSYGAVFSGPKMLPHHEWEYDERHTLERDGDCEVCGAWREPIGCLPNWNWPRGHGCRLYDTDYDLDPMVAYVPSHHGDTAIRSHKADAEYIEAMNPLVGKALAEWLRVEATRYAKHPPNVQDFLAGDIEGEEGELDYCVRIARLINGSRS